MDTTILYKPKDDDELYELLADGPEATLLKARNSLSDDTKDNMLLSHSNMSESEFIEYFESKCHLSV